MVRVGVGLGFLLKLWIAQIDCNLTIIKRSTPVTLLLTYTYSVKLRITRILKPFPVLIGLLALTVLFMILKEKDELLKS